MFLLMNLLEDDRAESVRIQCCNTGRNSVEITIVNSVHVSTVNNRNSLQYWAWLSDKNFWLLFRVTPCLFMHQTFVLPETFWIMKMLCFPCACLSPKIRQRPKTGRSVWVCVCVCIVTRSLSDPDLRRSYPFYRNWKIMLQVKKVLPSVLAA